MENSTVLNRFASHPNEKKIYEKRRHHSPPKRNFCDEIENEPYSKVR